MKQTSRDVEVCSGLAVRPPEGADGAFGGLRVDPPDDFASERIGNGNPVTRVPERIQRTSFVGLSWIVEGDSGRIGQKWSLALMLDPDGAAREDEAVLRDCTGMAEVLVRGRTAELADFDECRSEERADRVPCREQDFDNAITALTRRISAENTMQVNYYAVLAAALSTFIIGGLWYSPVLFQRAWMTANGLEATDLERGSPAAIFATSLLLAVIMSMNLAMFLAGPETALTWGATAGALTGLGWVAPALATVALFERRSWRYIAINGGYWVASFTVMGAILGAWR